jgi:hypothetical protein
MGIEDGVDEELQLFGGLLLYPPDHRVITPVLGGVDDKTLPNAHR